jgi:hypothetical protein
MEPNSSPKVVVYYKLANTTEERRLVCCYNQVIAEYRGKDALGDPTWTRRDGDAPSDEQEKLAVLRDAVRSLLGEGKTTLSKNVVL